MNAATLHTGGQGITETRLYDQDDRIEAIITNTSLLHGREVGEIADRANLREHLRGVGG